jgi:hypothetical protein
MAVSRTSAANVVLFARILRARVARLRMIYHMTVLVVHDSHLLQISNELEEVLEVLLVCS